MSDTQSSSLHSDQGFFNPESDSSPMPAVLLEPEPEAILKKVRNGADRLDDLQDELDVENYPAFHSSLISLVEDGEISLFPVGDVVKVRLEK